MKIIITVIAIASALASAASINLIISERKIKKDMDELVKLYRKVVQDE